MFGKSAFFVYIKQGNSLHFHILNEAQFGKRGFLCLNCLMWLFCQSREGSSIADDWDERPHTVEEVKAMLQQRKEAAMKRDKTLSQAFTQQVLKIELISLTLFGGIDWKVLLLIIEIELISLT